MKIMLDTFLRIYRQVKTQLSNISLKRIIIIGTQ